MPDDIEPLQRNMPTIAITLERISVSVAPPPKLDDIVIRLRQCDLMDRRYRAFQLRGEALLLERMPGTREERAFAWQVARRIRGIADEVEA